MSTEPLNALAERAKSPELQRVLDDQVLDAIYEALELSRSYHTSMMEACRRDDRHELGQRRRQIGASIKAAFELHTQLLNGGVK
jgi:hypothetical protein